LPVLVLLSAWRSILLCVLCAGLCACASQDKALPQPDLSTPENFRNATAAPDLPRPRTAWWQEFGSAELDRLVESALERNSELRVAVARIAQAHAQAGIADSYLYPTLDAFGRRERFAPEGGPGSVIEDSDWRGANRVRLGFRTTYEADLWGKYGYATDSALAQAAASEFHRDAVALTLCTEVAISYFEYLSISERTAIAQRIVQSQKSLLLAVERRAAIGDATTVEVARQRVVVTTAETTVAIFVQRRERAFNRLALLTGIAPTTLRIESRDLSQVGVPTIHPGLPSALLVRRPDLRRSEAQLAAADFDVKSVRANLLPSFSLIGEIGLGSRHLMGLTAGPGALFYLLATTLSQTVFDGGRKEAQLELSRARRLETLEQYSGALLTALREVEDALVATRFTTEQHAARSEAVRVSRLNYELHQKTFGVRGVDRLAVLDTEQRLYATEDAAAESRYDRLRAAIDLYKAIGGGSREASPGG
jgi:multidrug efflux system outer membrane protein